jgi:DNA (cytosine-5)-methyltransferase 1
MSPRSPKVVPISEQLHLSINHKKDNSIRLSRRTAISLFSGAGGLDFGIAKSDPRIQFLSWVESDPDCIDTLQANNPQSSTDSFHADIRFVTGKLLLSQCKISSGEAFLVAGGPPCQAFSTAGLRQSVNEERGVLVDNYFSIIRSVRPRFFVFENVRGLLSVAIKHSNYAERIERERLGMDKDLAEVEKLGSVFNLVVLPGLKRLGYEIVYGLVNSADYGSPQVRHRLVILGSRDNELGSGKFRKITGQRMTVQDLMPPTHHSLAPYLPISEWKTLRDAIWDLRDTPPLEKDCFTYSKERQAIWWRIPPGCYWTYIRDNPSLFPEGLKELMGGGYQSGGGKVGFWRRLSWDRPAPTLPTQPQHLATGLCHPDFERPLSVTEYQRIQGFPDEYIICGTKASRYKQIGNAVPVELGQAIGSVLTAIADKTDSKIESGQGDRDLDEGENEIEQVA